MKIKSLYLPNKMVVVFYLSLFIRMIGCSTVGQYQLKNGTMKTNNKPLTSKEDIPMGHINDRQEVSMDIELSDPSNIFNGDGNQLLFQGNNVKFSKRNS